MERFKIWYSDAVFVATNYMLMAGIIKNKLARRELAEKLNFGIELKGTYKPSLIIKLLPKLKKAS